MRELGYNPFKRVAHSPSLMCTNALTLMLRLEVALGVSDERVRVLEELCAAANKRAVSAVSALEQALPRCVLGI